MKELRRFRVNFRVATSCRASTTISTSSDRSPRRPSGQKRLMKWREGREMPPKMVDGGVKWSTVAGHG